MTSAATLLEHRTDAREDEQAEGQETMGGIETLLLLAAGHYLADFPLQTDVITTNKGRVFHAAIGFHALTAHAAVHLFVAAVVFTMLGHSWFFPALAIGASHWLIDFGKSWEGWPADWRITNGARWAGNPSARGLYGINVDQTLHIAVLAVLALAVTA